MNPPIVNRPEPEPVSDAAIDALVDGELSEADRRALLLQLENDPDGWRRCALAFLEDQAFRRALAGMRGVPAPIPGPARPARSSSWRWAIAASLLVSTFAAGLVAGGLGRRPDLAGSTPPTPAPAPAPTEAAPGSVELVSEPSRLPSLAEVPDERWSESSSPAVSGYDRARLGRRGYQVEERRRVVPVVLEDGRRVAIPVDEIALEYVGQQPF
jgi:anti-sigma factor RsiW